MLKVVVVLDLVMTGHFDSRKSKFDLEFESFGLSVLVDKKSHLYIKDTEIDWSND